MQISDRNREALILEMQKLHFYLVELNLFLDTHPDNREALRDYNSVHERYMSMHREYERRYGPLMNHGHSPSGYPWGWIEEPWPWETGK